jgi:MUN domain
MISLLFNAYLQNILTKYLVLNYFFTKHHKKHSLAKSIFFFILSFVKHQYHAKIDDQIDKALLSMTTGLINKLVSVLEATLGKLGRYDEGSLIGSFLSFTVSSKQQSRNE